MSACADRCWLCRWAPTPPSHPCCSPLWLQMHPCWWSRKSVLGVFVLWAWWCCAEGGVAPAPAVALTLFFKVTSEGGAFGWMCGRLIKCCSLPRLMGQIAHYAGLYIMSNCLLLPLPANEPPSYTWEWSREGKLRFELSLCSRKGWKGAACSGSASGVCHSSFTARRCDTTPSSHHQEQIWCFIGASGQYVFHLPHLQKEANGN